MTVSYAVCLTTKPKNARPMSKSVCAGFLLGPRACPSTAKRGSARIMESAMLDLEWRAIPGYAYEVSSTGNVRNAITRKVLAPMRTGWRAVVRLSTNPRVDFPVSHLVLSAFSGARPLGGVAMHMDDDPHNNRANNLRWGTMQDNARDMAQKCRGGKQVLTAEVVTEIRARRASGERGRELAVAYGISEQRVCDIHKGRTTL
jgi:hypothetical protein